MTCWKPVSKSPKYAFEIHLVSRGWSRYYAGRMMVMTCWRAGIGDTRNIFRCVQFHHCNDKIRWNSNRVNERKTTSDGKKRVASLLHACPDAVAFPVSCLLTICRQSWPDSREQNPAVTDQYQDKNHSNTKTKRKRCVATQTAQFPTLFFSPSQQ